MVDDFSFVQKRVEVVVEVVEEVVGDLEEEKHLETLAW